MINVKSEKIVKKNENFVKIAGKLKSDNNVGIIYENLKNDKKKNIINKSKKGNIVKV